MTTTPESEGSEVLLWRVSCGQIGKKNPIAVVDHGDGTVTVNKKDRRGFRTVQPKVDAHESYHATHRDAVVHILDQAQRDLDRAESAAFKARRRLSSARARLSHFLKDTP